MNFSGAAINGHDINFRIRADGNVPIEYLSITPNGFLDYCGKFENDAVSLTICLSMPRCHILVDDYLLVGDIARVGQLLSRLIGGEVDAENYTTLDGQLNLGIEYRMDTHDVHFSGRIPAFEYTELLEKPLVLRNNIFRTLEFQFALDFSALARPVAQIQDLLSLVRSLKKC